MMIYQPNLAFLTDIGAGEIVVILLAALILFGGKGLPTLARKLGNLTQKLQQASNEFKRQIITADLPPPPPPPDHDADKP